MVLLTYVLAVMSTVWLCSLADCNTGLDSCRDGQEEHDQTSLVQVKKIVNFGTDRFESAEVPRKTEVGEKKLPASAEAHLQPWGQTVDSALNIDFLEFQYHYNLMAQIQTLPQLHPVNQQVASHMLKEFPTFSPQAAAQMADVSATIMDSQWWTTPDFLGVSHYERGINQPPIFRKPPKRGPADYNDQFAWDYSRDTLMYPGNIGALAENGLSHVVHQMLIDVPAKGLCGNNRKLAPASVDVLLSSSAENNMMNLALTIHIAMGGFTAISPQLPRSLRSMLSKQISTWTEISTADNATTRLWLMSEDDDLDSVLEQAQNAVVAVYSGTGGTQFIRQLHTKALPHRSNDRLIVAAAVPCNSLACSSSLSFSCGALVILGRGRLKVRPELVKNKAEGDVLYSEARDEALDMNERYSSFGSKWPLKDMILDLIDGAAWYSTGSVPSTHECHRIALVTCAFGHDRVADSGGNWTLNYSAALDDAPRAESFLYPVEQTQADMVHSWYTKLGNKSASVCRGSLDVLAQIVCSRLRSNIVNAAKFYDAGADFPEGMNEHFNTVRAEWRTLLRWLAVLEARSTSKLHSGRQLMLSTNICTVPRRGGEELAKPTAVDSISNAISSDRKSVV